MDVLPLSHTQMPYKHWLDRYWKKQKPQQQEKPSLLKPDQITDKSSITWDILPESQLFL